MYNKKNQNKNKYLLPPVGMRIFKTVLSCLLVALIYKYLLGGRNPCFACIGAVYAMGSQFQEGFHNGFNRFVGSFIGGILVIPFYWLSINQVFGLPEWFYMVIGLFFVIYLNLACGANNAIQPGTVIYFVIFYTQPEASYISYALARIIDTGVGVIFSLGLSLLMPYNMDQSRGNCLSTAIYDWFNNCKSTRPNRNSLLDD